jgi:hypothetical protein
MEDDDDNLEAQLQKIPMLLKKRERDLERREEELRKKEASLKAEYPNHGSSEDVLPLNIGGTCIYVLRRTITQIEDSMLANMFSGRWDDSLPKDPDGRFFIDQEYDKFGPLIRYLRELGNQTEFSEPPVPPPNGRPFYDMLEYYKMTFGIFQIACCSVRNNDFGQHYVVGVYPEIELSSEEQKTTYWLAPHNAHSRYVKSFEVTMGPHSSVQVGWASWDVMKDAFVENENGNAGAGYTGTSAAFDSSRSGMVVNGTFTPSPDVAVKEGTTIRCEGKGLVWKFNGVTKVSTIDSPIPDTIQIEKIWQDRIENVQNISKMRPCLTLKGSCRITNIELDS